MLPKKGKKLPAWKGALGGRQAYADVMADLLKKEHGDSHRAVKLLMRQTDASERTIKHWLAAQHGPDTVFFLRLVATSPVIRAFVLGVIESPVMARQSSRPMRWDVAPLTPDAAAANTIRQLRRSALHQGAKLPQPLVRHADRGARDGQGADDLGVLVEHRRADAAQTVGPLLVVDGPAAPPRHGQVRQQGLRIDDGAPGELRQADAVQDLGDLRLRQPGLDGLAEA